MADKLSVDVFTAVKKRIVNSYNENPYVNLLKMDIKELKEGETVIELNVEKEYTNFYNIAHGGILMSVADTAMGSACLTCNKRVVTLSFSMNFIKAARFQETVKIIGRVLHNGSRTMACEADLINKDGVLLGKATATMFVMGDLIASE